jgi:hypothetical protein
MNMFVFRLDACNVNGESFVAVDCLFPLNSFCDVDLDQVVAVGY